MEINEAMQQEIKEFIKRNIEKNGGVFDRNLKMRLKKIISSKLKKDMPVNYDLFVPYDISEQSVDRILKNYGLDLTQINVISDKSIIGGFILRSNSKLIDASIHGHITSLTQDMYEGSR